MNAAECFQFLCVLRFLACPGLPWVFMVCAQISSLKKNLIADNSDLTDSRRPLVHRKLWPCEPTIYRLRRYSQFW